MLLASKRETGSCYAPGRHIALPILLLVLLDVLYALALVLEAEGLVAALLAVGLGLRARSC
jgi:hypothetical protein